MALPKEKYYTPEEFYSMDLPECCELIYGDIYIGESEEKYNGGEITDMSPAPNFFHQEISGNVYTDISVYIRKQKGKCKVFTAPTDVKIGDNTVQPDIFVTCDPSKINGQYHNGAPDWAIEILSPSTAKRDTVYKMRLYKESGVREYWLIDPERRWVIVYPFEENKNLEVYTFETPVTAHIYKNEPEPLVIRLADYL